MSGALVEGSDIMEILFVVLGLCFGSFIGAYTFRTIKGVSIYKGRSRCFHCQRDLYWYDNIPLLSYVILAGKCRFCNERIGFREPLIEFSCTILFLLVLLRIDHLVYVLPWTQNLGIVGAILYSLVLVSLLLSVFITDIEHYIILDEVVFLGWLVTILFFLLSASPLLFVYLLSGFSASLFLLILHIVTYGNGMGLGDVKLALFVGTVLGPYYTLVWLMASFISGAVLGVLLLALGKAHLGKKIAFGPYLVVSCICVLLWI